MDINENRAAKTIATAAVTALSRPARFAASVKRPQFDNANLASGARWMGDNYAALRTYFNACGHVLPDPRDSSSLGLIRAQRFLNFCTNTWTREREVRS